MEEIEQLQASYNTGGLEAVIPEIKNKLDNLDNAPVNIAVAGEASSGKSTFLRALIGLGMGEEGKAGSGETNGEAIAYPHPDLPNVQLWELPGTNCPDPGLSDYLEMVKAERYDMFLVVSDCRFEGSDRELALAIQREGKPFYLVRSKVDSLLPLEEVESAASKDGLQRLRLDCVANLEARGLKDPALFLVSGFDQGKFDFPVLKATLAVTLKNVKKTAFLLSLPGVTSRIIEGKRKTLERRIWMTATLAGAVGAVPVPGLSFATGAGLLMAGLVYLWRHLDLREKCLRGLAAVAGKPLILLQSETQSPGRIFRAAVRVLLGVTAVACTVAEVKLGITPLIVSVLGAVSSFTFTAMLLKDSLNERVKATQRVVRTAFDTN